MIAKRNMLFSVSILSDSVYLGLKGVEYPLYIPSVRIPRDGGVLY